MIQLLLRFSESDIQPVQTTEELHEVVKKAETIVSSPQPVPSPRTSLTSPTSTLPVSCNIDSYNDEIDATLQHLMQNMPVIEPKLYLLEDLHSDSESEVVNVRSFQSTGPQAVNEIAVSTNELRFGSAPEIERIGEAQYAGLPLADPFPRKDSLDLEEVIRNVEKTNEEMRLMIEEEQRYQEQEFACSAPLFAVDGLPSADELRLVREEAEFDGFVRSVPPHPLDRVIDATYEEVLHPHEAANPARGEDLEKFLRYEEDLQFAPQLQSRSSRRSITIEHLVDRQPHSNIARTATSVHGLFRRRTRSRKL
jgi:hypothetical protein